MNIRKRLCVVLIPCATGMKNGCAGLTFPNYGNDINFRGGSTTKADHLSNSTICNANAANSASTFSYALPNSRKEDGNFTDHKIEESNHRQGIQEMQNNSIGDIVVRDSSLNVLFLSADTGGGHRASAESLANQFQKIFPGTTYNILDVWTPTKVFPYHTLVPSYKWLSAHPRQWKLLYHFSNTRIYEYFTNVHSSFTCFNKIKKQMERYQPDLVVSVHPTMNMVPQKVMQELANDRGTSIPFVTVVTDFGTGHCTWFQKDVDKLYIASDGIKKIARKRANVPEDKIAMLGLPIRDSFAIQADKMVDRTSIEGKSYRSNMKTQLGLNPEKKTILVMGGGEGVGSLSRITHHLYLELKNKGVDATILVVCGRNEKLKKELNIKDWEKIKMPRQKSKFNNLGFGRFRKGTNSCHSNETGKTVKYGEVNVVGLGFINNMAEYMVATDVLVSKAGPGTIAEAAAVGLPVMITSFLPGQEAGNVDIVLDNKFGGFCRNPKKIAKILTTWLQDESKLDSLSYNSAKVGNPHAASNIVHDIGKITFERISKNRRQEEQ